MRKIVSDLVKGAIPVRWALLVLLGILVCGCSAQYGRLEHSRELTRAFRSGHVFSGYLYYYSGYEQVPTGIIGIQERYSLNSRIWREIDLTDIQLRQMVARMARIYNVSPRGSWILDADGRRVGIWYSARYQTTVRLNPDHQITVVSPESPELRGIP